MLASSWCQQGKLQLQVNQICSKELAWWEQLEVRYAGKLKNYQKHIVKTIVCSRPEVPQNGPKRAPGIILRDLLVAWRPFLGPPWAHLGPSWALLALLGLPWTTFAAKLPSNFAVGHHNGRTKTSKTPSCKLCRALDLPRTL